MGSNPATPTDRSPDHRSTPSRHQSRRGVHAREEHRREPEPDPRSARRRGALRRPEAQPGRRLQGDRLRRSASPASGPGKVPTRIIDQRVGRGAVLQEAVNEALPRPLRRGRPRARAAAARPARDRHHQPRRLRRRLADLHRRGRHPARDHAARPRRHRRHRRRRRGHRRRRRRAARRAARPLRHAEGRRAPGRGRRLRLDRPRLRPSTARRSRAARPTGLSYEVGSGDLVDGLDEAITGKSAGETATFTTTLRQGEHAGREAEVTVTVKSVKVKELPELDDEFAQLASEFDTVDELRADLRTRLGRVKALEQGAQARDKLLEQLIETSSSRCPSRPSRPRSSTASTTSSTRSATTTRCSSRYLESQGKTREEFDAELRESAEKSVRAQFILDADRREDRGADRRRRADRSTSSGRPRATRWRRRSSPTRSSSPATCRCSSPTSAATRRWPRSSSRRRSPTRRATPVDLTALSRRLELDGRRRGRRTIAGRRRRRRSATDDAD